MTEEQEFRERIRNWARVFKGSANAPRLESTLARYVEIWREEKRKASSVPHADIEDAVLIERAILRIPEPDRKLIIDWYMRDSSIGRVARMNGIFVSHVMIRLMSAERKLFNAVESIQCAIDKIN